MGLADQVIEANEKPIEEPEEEKFFTDDIGISVKKDYRKDYQYYTGYLVARAFKINDKLNKRGDGLFNGDELVLPNAEDIAVLTRYPEPIPKTMVVNIHKRIWEMAPELNPDILVVGKGLGWDLTKGEFVKIGPNVKVI